MRYLQYQHLKNKYYIVFSVLMTTLLVGCGFHLRNNSVKSHQLKQLYVISHEADFGNILQRSMQNAGIIVQPNAPWLVDIISIQIQDNKQYLSNTHVNYSLSGSVTWTLKNAAGIPLFKPRIINQDTLFLENSNTTNTSDTLQKQSRSKLKQELADAVIRQISAISTEDLQHKNQLIPLESKVNETNSASLDR